MFKAFSRHFEGRFEDILKAFQKHVKGILRHFEDMLNAPDRLSRRVLKAFQRGSHRRFFLVETLTIKASTIAIEFLSITLSKTF